MDALVPSLCLSLLRSLALDDLCEPGHSFVHSLAGESIRLLDMPGPVRDVGKPHRICDLLHGMRVWQVRLVSEEKHWQLPVCDV